MKDGLNKQAVESVRSYYNCCNCSLSKYCRFGGGKDTSWDCNECTADEYYDGYIQALNDLNIKDTYDTRINETNN